VLKAAAQQAIERFGLHSAGSPALLGNSTESVMLANEIGESLHAARVTLYPTGWAAGFGVVTALIRPYDHIVMDEFAHACLQSGAYAATANIIKHKHLAVDEVREHLHMIRSSDTRNGIVVITEGLFSMDSDTPDICALQEICHEYGATLLVDIAHDFGALGPGGTGSIGMQAMLGKVDLVMGSFSKTFASNGGFVATQAPAVHQYLKFYGSPQTFSNALSPVQAAIVRAALQIVRSDEGEQRRQQLKIAVAALRAGLSSYGIEHLGTPSAIVPVLLGGAERARMASKLVAEQGILVNLVEFPAVAVDASRFRFQVMAAHTVEHANRAAQVVASVLHELRAVPDSLHM
jgi:7-keto-8-aminopelargonate synthetase-like enzyme